MEWSTETGHYNDFLFPSLTTFQVRNRLSNVNQERMLSREACEIDVEDSEVEEETEGEASTRSSETDIHIAQFRRQVERRHESTILGLST